MGPTHETEWDRPVNEMTPDRFASRNERGDEHDGAGDWEPGGPDRPCWTCGRPTSGRFPDGSPQYDHGYDPDVGETRWPRDERSGTDDGPSLALLMGREQFTSRDGRRFERWSFVTWVRQGERHHALEVTGVTGTSGRRRDEWQSALSASGWCHLDLEERAGRVAVRQMRPVWHLSWEQVMAYADDADAEDVDLVVEATHIFSDMLPGDTR